MATEQPPPEREESAREPDVQGETAGESAVRRPRGHARTGPPRTRTSIAFSGLTAGAIVLALLLVFILENTQSVKISYFDASGHLALGVALLLAAVGGALVIGILGAVRIAQVRRHARRRSAGHPRG